jgi:hypothetical protein
VSHALRQRIRLEFVIGDEVRAGNKGNVVMTADTCIGCELLSYFSLLS